MKLAVATEGDRVAPHFGRCPEYTIAEIDGNRVIHQEIIPNPGHRPGFLPEFLAEKGIDCIITGGIGHKAREIFSRKEIEVIAGISGEVNPVLEVKSRGELEEGDNLCSH